MKIECPVCHIQGILEKRGNSYRILHYRGFINGKRVYEKHSFTPNGNKSMGINKPNLDSEHGGRSLVWLGHQPPTLYMGINNYKEYLSNKYSKQYASLLFSYFIKYQGIMDDPSLLLTLPFGIQQNVLKALVARSKYLGCYKQFTESYKNHGIKWSKNDSFSTFIRIFNSNAHSGLGQWYKDSIDVLSDHEKLYLQFMLLSGIRKNEGIQSFNLLISLNDKFLEYYNEETGYLEHFKYPKLFLRNSKNVYVTAIPKEFIDKIIHSELVFYSTIRKKLSKFGLKLRIKDLRSFYATRMRELGLLSEQIDLLQGRIPKSIFLQYYFKQNPKRLNHKIIRLLSKLEQSLLIT